LFGTMPTQIRMSFNKYSNVSNLKRKSSSSTVFDYMVTIANELISHMVFVKAYYNFFVTKSGL
jgi:hypothetical protein